MLLVHGFQPRRIRGGGRSIGLLPSDLKTIQVHNVRDADIVEQLVGGVRYSLVPMPEVMKATTAYVGNLCEFVCDQDLSDLFAQVSTLQSIPSCVVRKPDTTSLQYGFVSFPTEIEKIVSVQICFFERKCPLALWLFFCLPSELSFSLTVSNGTVGRSKWSAFETIPSVEVSESPNNWWNTCTVNVAHRNHRHRHDQYTRRNNNNQSQRRCFIVSMTKNRPSWNALRDGAIYQSRINIPEGLQRHWLTRIEHGVPLKISHRSSCTRMLGTRPWITLWSTCQRFSCRTTMILL